MRVQCPGAKEVVLLAPTEVDGSLGSTVTLLCHLQHLESKIQRVTQIRWKRLELLGDPSIVAEFHWEWGPSILEPDRVGFLAARLGADLLDASLAISELSPGDEANYTCEIHIGTSQMWSASTWLRVFYAPQVSIALYDDIGQQGRRETSLTCDARSNPEPKSYDWSTTTGPLLPSAVPQGSRLLIQPTEESINTTFICLVSNDLGTGQAAMSFHIPEAREVVVLAPTELHGSLGSTVTLPCHLQPLESKTLRVTEIRWKRLDPLGDPSIVAKFQWERDPSIPEPDHVEFKAARLGADLQDTSLKLHGLSHGDKANCTYAFQDHGPPAPSAVPLGFRLLIQPTEESTNTTFICCVFSDLGTGQAAMRVQLPGARKVVVRAPTKVNGSLGSTVTLPCHLLLESEIPRVTEIRWKRLAPLGDPSIVAEFYWEWGPIILEPDRLEFKAARLGADLLDASLTIRELSPGDEANYTCEVHISTSQMGSALTWLRVFYSPQVSIALYDDIGQQGRRETSLTCDARSNPEPKSYDWSTTTGPLPPSAVPQGSWLLIHPTEESINTTFICRVSNDLGMGQAAMRVLIPELSCSAAFNIG
ncbi:poliovirus receptor-like [Sorex fumeus]|uniref:poliovirus receptor-like n=1 Tax=Sorex fumeus TaxID=62283 RepID=UPI0024AE7493|nr:poliovirus receptor-like [Sorex fumeus]